ncbi:hypothetical protein NHP164001_00050 [Helicobacter trogontum]|uniref:acylphosphatase n=1 Tax=Helicobacter trogontum TaxID=50960 RepID=A0ABQ0D0Z8_9HELI
MQQDIYTIHITNNQDSITTLLHNLQSYMQKVDMKQYTLYTEVFGMIQGVGFRPFVATLAQTLHLHGSIYNQSSSVAIILHISRQKECTESILLFYTALLLACQYTIDYAPSSLSLIKKASDILTQLHIPKQALITSLGIAIRTDIAYAQGFHILESKITTHHAIQAYIPLDTKICESCLKDMQDKDSRFYNYPFVACVNCGARYSILHNLPYDRRNTSMRDMELCIDCKKDYVNLANRRFHTEPISCSQCAIKVEFYRYGQHEKYYDIDALKALAHALINDEIILFKGLGGFAYIANARSNDALQKIRQIKNRKHKPFVVMATIPTLRTISLLTPQLESLLTAKEAPIVITPKHPQYNLSDEVSSLQTIGIMIPYTAMLTLLFSYLPSDFALIYTSANNKGEMIATTLHNLALDRIMEVAQSFYILDYDREILNCVDDSILLGINALEDTKTNLFKQATPLNIQNKEVDSNNCYTKQHKILNLDSKRVFSSILKANVTDIDCCKSRLVTSSYDYTHKNNETLESHITQLNAEFEKQDLESNIEHKGATTHHFQKKFCANQDKKPLNTDSKYLEMGAKTQNSELAHRGVQDLREQNTQESMQNLDCIAHSLNARAIRISRGFAPLHITSNTCDLKILGAAFGAMQKSSIAFGLHNHVVVSPYMGDLFTPYNIANFRKTFDYFSALYGTPQALIADRHNQYISTQIAKEVASASNIPLFQVAHHHAHFNALLFESNMKEGVGVIFDGSGLGDDGTLWGGEFLCGDSKGVTRILHFKPFKILGGEKHIKDCKRLAYSYALCNDIVALKSFIESSYDENECKALQALHNMNFNSPLCSSVGRLFDIAGFILGLEQLSYEAQSGELIASNTLNYAYSLLSSTKQKIDYNTLMQTLVYIPYNPYPFHITQNMLDISECIELMFRDKQAGKDSNVIALRFIDTLAYCILESLRHIDTDYAFFGGGVFANYALCMRVKTLLQARNIHTFFPKFPCSDYSISVGQLMYLQHLL